MKPVLVVEDSTMVTKVIRHVLGQSQKINVDYAGSLAEAQALLAKKDYFCALVDLSLPDAPSGEVVDEVLAKNIPCIVLTSTFDEKRRTELLNKGVVDYVTKEGRYSYELALATIHRLIKNQDVKVLVVDDSKTQRKVLSQLFRLHLFQVLEAEDGVHAIKQILEHSDICLLVTDYNMPRMDGFELIKNLRAKYEKSDLVIVGLSSEEESSLSAKFIKSGANDFLKKPFNHEEFFCRINHNVEFLELIESIRDAANRDELCSCYNRSYFFKHGELILQKAKESASPLSLALIEIENFEQFQAERGNDESVLVLQQVAQRLNSHFERFFFARVADSTFAVLMPGLDNEKACAYVDQVRQLCTSKAFQGGCQEHFLGFSAGITSFIKDQLDDVHREATSCLQRARDAGGALVIGD
ncbi:response regulator [Agaribacterium sp. ZY112]|uniref:GGDEF domain-containing response regulator n=1 Tax=Agaribacterium sp. ZY112 TaxID=3233574 RepID=UPI0035256423